MVDTGNGDIAPISEALTAAGSGFSDQVGDIILTAPPPRRPRRRSGRPGRRRLAPATWARPTSAASSTSATLNPLADGDEVFGLRHHRHARPHRRSRVGVRPHTESSSPATPSTSRPASSPGRRPSSPPTQPPPTPRSTHSPRSPCSRSCPATAIPSRPTRLAPALTPPARCACCRTDGDRAPPRFFVALCAVGERTTKIRLDGLAGRPMMTLTPGCGDPGDPESRPICIAMIPPPPRKEEDGTCHGRPGRHRAPGRRSSSQANIEFIAFDGGCRFFDNRRAGGSFSPSEFRMLSPYATALSPGGAPNAAFPTTRWPSTHRCRPSAICHPDRASRPALPVPAARNPSPRSCSS